eukprot:10193438-Heterocapsa_arctica.AAC.1
MHPKAAPLITGMLLSLNNDILYQALDDPGNMKALINSASTASRPVDLEPSSDEPAASTGNQ